MPTRTTQETPKKAKATASSGKANALQRPLQPSEALAAVVGPGPLPRGEVVSKVWEYIKSHNLQNPENRREILADDKLKGLRQGQGDHVRDEQAPRPASDLTACAIGLGLPRPDRPALRRSLGHPIPPMTMGDLGPAGRAAPARMLACPPQSQGQYIKRIAATRGSASFRSGAGACTRRSKRQYCRHGLGSSTATATCRTTDW